MASMDDNNVDMHDADDVEQKRSSRVRTKGRGFRGDNDDDNDERFLRSGTFESFEEIHEGVQKSVEGFVLIVTGVHEEATEQDIEEKFGEFGEMLQIVLNLDRRTGFVKGYALVEFKRYDDADNARRALNDTDILEQKVSVDWAFKPKPEQPGSFRRRGGGRNSFGNRRQRSRSPRR
eukprot:TRINITY_DN3276_c0_g1_i1.p1 TRINITY_DN3276_c0_g1~~TRINITY_DN3276_c0_g1_i1.p1  ORF type:complete len:177 (+),score=33.47 TRINITY_DN3276_c0_g1_i1:61-591(+)